MTEEHRDDDPVRPQVIPPGADLPEPGSEEQPPREASSFVTEPSKLLRIASMTRAMLNEVRQAPLDEAGRRRLLAIYRGSLDELKEILSEDLQEEMDAIFLPLEREAPTESELRVAQAQLVGWLEGLFHGIQASLWSQQMSAQAQLEQMRRRKALEAKQREETRSGLYL